MKRIKTICLLAAAAVLTLAPISTGQTQSQTIYASQVLEDQCINLGNGVIRCPNKDGVGQDFYDPDYQAPSRSPFFTWISGWFNFIWQWFKSF
ncbi:hypothetical protein KUG02_02090 [Streptococcus equi subsp. zooepidemicus]|uniref:hypothetical protein n=1 Tax=Streptococcus equi TaxID=1336 RepID=UPI0005A0970D|nr:hypothetical protein [Streptococcus equi]KIS09913.1 hypothetical protein N594_01820 [Streptococcus equi subsp. zooepidemicus Sz16]KIS20594.1 hypothetical protein AT49_01822 [Streptococcus equi subsp. zooepidemicus SzAM35]MCD3374967.1 hypothetical protein [Streptococcus equi subsp. zooepidemicus]MCD3398185.1 hypothetical protein [Streptococcus equi subsp. zooepidemicus]MCD3405712.1 hypothetical protein [Streptococcus equi subsp. zooepidemicus]